MAFRDRATSYAVVIDPDAPNSIGAEYDCFTCAHCQKIVHVAAGCRAEDLGGRCMVCDGLICPACCARDFCDPVEAKLERSERVGRRLADLLEDARDPAERLAMFRASLQELHEAEPWRR